MSNELNKVVTQILSKNDGNPKQAIQQLFNLLANQPQQTHDVIKKAILFSMQNLHEWANMIKYLQKWNLKGFRPGFIQRMRKRLNQSHQEDANSESMDEVKRLIETYWKTRSPKKVQNHYKDVDLLGSVTGRPPILKKKSFIQNQIKLASKSEQSIGQEENKPKNPEQNNLIKGRLQSSGIRNMVKKFRDTQEIKPSASDNWDTFGKQEENSIPVPQTNPNQSFPPDKFQFGSNKKVVEPEIVKKIPISPLKYDPKVRVKIQKNQEVKQAKDEEQKKGEHSPLQFSFMSQKKIQPPSKNTESVVSQFILFKQQPKEHQQIKIYPKSDQFVFKQTHDSNSNDFLNDSFNHIKSSAQTPQFVFQDKKRRSSSKFHQLQQIDQQLNLIDPNIKIRYFMKEILQRNKADMKSIFEEEFQKFINRQESY